MSVHRDRRHCLRALLLGLLAGLTACSTPKRPSVAHTLLGRELWIDLVKGDEVSDAEVLEELARAGVVYVGEYHANPRHHEIQLWLLQESVARRVPLVLCLEQLEAPDQPVVDRYLRREIDFATLAREIDWATKWRNYADYAGLCAFARQHRIPIRALNARSDLIRTVSRGGGISKLSSEDRAQLPAEILLDDPAYEQLTALEFGVHAGMEPAKLRPMFEAQVARDEAMAANIVAARHVDAAKPRTAFVVLGAGHMRYGLGTAARVRRREPGIVERLVLLSESGRLRLSAETAENRDRAIAHSELRRIERPPADYVRVLPLSSTTLPPGHPPVSH